ncbi:MAG: beta-ketoacyl synthase chain length factor [Gammaproteobacteria bacterium]
MTATTRLQAWIDGIGLIAPGLPDWPSAREVLAGRRPWQPAPSVLPAPLLLPPAERRRASRVIRVALALGQEAVTHAGADAASLTTVFAASGADGHNCHALCEQLASDDRQISPTRFHNSVHNAAAGYWGIATHSMAPCQVICAGDGSLGAGLLDAIAQVVLDQRPVLLVVYDSEYPEPLHTKRPTPDTAGLALVLSPQRSDRSLAHMAVGTGAALSAASLPATPLADPGLAQLQQALSLLPSLRLLPVLQALACHRSATVLTGYLPDLPLTVDLQPC